MRDGHRNDCKSCNLAAKQARYRANPRPYVERAREWQRRNRELHLERQRSYRERNRDRIRLDGRNRHLLKTYGIDYCQFALLVKAQFGACQICLSEQWENLHVDHDHETGAIRGLLCGKCNKAIGLLNEDPFLMRQAAKYMERVKKHEKLLNSIDYRARRGSA